MESSNKTLSEPEKTKIFRSLQLFHFFNDGLVLLYPVLMVTYFDRFHLEWYQTGLVFSMNILMIVIFQIINGYFVDKGKIKQIMYFGMFGVAISGYFLHFVTDFSSLLTIAIIMGFCFGFVHSINYYVTMRLYPDRKNEKLARQGFAGDLGKLVSIFLASILLIFFDETIPVLVWNMVCTISAIYSAIIMRKINFRELFSPQNNIKKVQNTQESDIKDPQQSKQNSEKRRIILLFCLLFLFNGYFDVVGKNIATYLFDTRTGFVSVYSEIVYAILFLAGTIGTYNAGTIRNKLGLKKHLTLVYIILISTLLTFLLIHPNDVFLVLLLMGPNFFFMLTVYTNIFGPVSNRINQDKLGLSMGLLLGLGWLGGFTSTWIGGRLANINPDYLLWFALGICFISLILILTMNRSKYEK
jgi:predicted MFS family arabinose efflux permease